MPYTGDSINLAYFMHYAIDEVAWDQPLYKLLQIFEVATKINGDALYEWQSTLIFFAKAQLALSCLYFAFEKI